MAETFPQRIRQWREQRGWSLSQAAKAVGTTKPHLWELENGHTANPTLKLLRGMAKAYGVTVGELIDGYSDDYSRGWNDCRAKMITMCA